MEIFFGVCKYFLSVWLNIFLCTYIVVSLFLCIAHCWSYSLPLACNMIYCVIFNNDALISWHNVKRLVATCVRDIRSGERTANNRQTTMARIRQHINFTWQTKPTWFLGYWGACGHGKHSILVIVKSSYRICLSFSLFNNSLKHKHEYFLLSL